MNGKLLSLELDLAESEQLEHSKIYEFLISCLRLEIELEDECIAKKLMGFKSILVHVGFMAMVPIIP